MLMMRSVSEGRRGRVVQQETTGSGGGGGGQLRLLYNGGLPHRYRVWGWDGLSGAVRQQGRHARLAVRLLKSHLVVTTVKIFLLHKHKMINFVHTYGG